MIPGPVEDHRGREGGNLVYPVFSRRSRGVSVGINLFPDKKRCSFDCPYCEVFPFAEGAEFSLALMEESLQAALAGFARQGTPVADVCFSGSGEPTMSVHFPSALESAARIREEFAPAAALVLITNGTGLLDPGIFEILRQAAAGPFKLDIWLKLDAGTEAWYQRMARSSVPFAALTGKIREFVRCAPATLQTMLCAAGGAAPSGEEASAWERLAAELAGGGGPSGGLRKIQLYGKARPSPLDPLAEALDASYLEARAASLRRALAGMRVPVEVFP